LVLVEQLRLVDQAALKVQTLYLALSLLLVVAQVSMPPIVLVVGQQVGLVVLARLKLVVLVRQDKAMRVVMLQPPLMDILAGVEVVLVLLGVMQHINKVDMVVLD
jgi:mRNA-degrading endonuclease toxin of MazEF toxin-antitoxin module